MRERVKQPPSITPFAEAESYDKVYAMNILDDLKIPGSNFLRWAMIILIIAPLMISFCFSDSKILSLSLKIMVALLDVICLYIVFWILKRGEFHKYSKIIIAISVVALGETIIAFL